MARSIVLNFDGEVSEFGITRLRRDKLYGRKKKIVVDETGVQCTMASLTRDGSTLLPSGAVSYLYMNDHFEVCERSDLTAVDAEGEALEKVDSTLGSEQPLEGPVAPQRVLDHTAKAVYELDPQDIGDKLVEALEDGGIFESRFNYRRGYDDNPLFLLKNDEGFFAIIGEEAAFEYLRPEEEIEPEEDEEDPFDDDDLDFSF